MTTTPTNARLRELIRAHEDRASDGSLPYAEIQIARETVEALKELQGARATQEGRSDG